MGRGRRVLCWCEARPDGQFVIGHLHTTLLGRFLVHAFTPQTQKKPGPVSPLAPNDENKFIRARPISNKPK
jgi:hypothetical protein